MKLNINYVLIYIVLCSSCTIDTQKTKENEPGTHSVILTQEPIGIKQLAIFSKCSNYDNNLSSIASEVKFIQLDINPLLNSFRVFDMEICDNYIFLSGLGSIYQYDRTGHYIKNIGRHGRGPMEYFRLSPPLQLDCKKKLIFALDMTYRKNSYL